MRPAASVSTRQGSSRPTIKLRDDQYVLYTNVLDWTTDASRARAFSLDETTIYRARSGGNVGEAFIAQTLAVLKRPANAGRLNNLGLKVDFDALFYVEAGTS